MDVNNNKAGQTSPVAQPVAVAVPQQSNRNLWIAIVVLVLILVGGGCYLWNRLTANAGVRSDEYQAVFLTNGNVYFGKLTLGRREYRLTDVYYLLVQQSLQQPTDKQAQNQQPKVSLAKLGGELHGPEDEMRISRDQVVFWENIKNTSQVVQAIQRQSSGG